MGKLIKMLSRTNLDNIISPFQSCLRAKQAEHVAFYWRNVRTAMDELNFSHFSAMVKNVTPCTSADSEKILFDGELDGIQQLNNELSIELNEGNVIHIHYRDIRIEMKRDEFELFSECVEEAHFVLHQIPTAL